MWMATWYVIVPRLPFAMNCSTIRSSFGIQRFALTGPLSVMPPVARKVPSPTIPQSTTASLASFVPAITTLTGLRSVFAVLDAVTASSPPDRATYDEIATTTRKKLTVPTYAHRIRLHPFPPAVAYEGADDLTAIRRKQAA